jgi:hypothetical protein
MHRDFTAARTGQSGDEHQVIVQKVTTAVCTINGKSELYVFMYAPVNHDALTPNAKCSRAGPTTTENRRNVIPASADTTGSTMISWPLSQPVRSEIQSFIECAERPLALELLTDSRIDNKVTICRIKFNSAIPDASRQESAWPVTDKSHALCYRPQRCTCSLQDFAIIVRSHGSSNDPGSGTPALDSRMQAEASNRRCLQPVCSPVPPGFSAPSDY